ncbi:unnamed protein product, partial [Discosporangium mesarthrocarpum]
MAARDLPFPYDVLTPKVVDGWRKDGSPPEGVAKAFASAEKDFMDQGTLGVPMALIPTLKKIFMELVWRVVTGMLAAKSVATWLKSGKGPRSFATVKADEDDNNTVQDALCDAIWGVGSMVRGTGAPSSEGTGEWLNLCGLVAELGAQGVVSQFALQTLLTEEVLVGAGLIKGHTPARGGKKPETIFASRLRKINTELVYKQRKFNLLREETEGYSKLCVLLNAVQEEARASGAGGKGGQGEMVVSEVVGRTQAQMLSIMGYFDLDPNRALDLTLEALEMSPWNRALLLLVDTFEAHSLPHVVGFKLAFYRHPEVVRKLRAGAGGGGMAEGKGKAKERDKKVTPKSLYVLCATLLATDRMTLESLLPHMTPTVDDMAAAEKRQRRETVCLGGGQQGQSAGANGDSGRQ